MNAALRRRHRRMTLALALIVPPALAGSLALRADRPDAAIPGALLDEPGTGATLLARDDLFAPLAITTRVLAGAAGDTVLELAPRVDLERPDVLVYWSRDGALDRLPEGALLLGRLGGTEARRFALPDGARGGRVHLWSLGHGALVGAAALE